MGKDFWENSRGCRTKQSIYKVSYERTMEMNDIWYHVSSCGRPLEFWMFSLYVPACRKLLCLPAKAEPVHGLAQPLCLALQLFCEPCRFLCRRSIGLHDFGYLLHALGQLAQGG